MIRLIEKKEGAKVQEAFRGEALICMETGPFTRNWYVPGEAGEWELFTGATTANLAFKARTMKKTSPVPGLTVYTQN